MTNHSRLTYAILSGGLCIGSATAPLSATATEFWGSAAAVSADSLPQEAVSVTISGPDGNQSYDADAVAPVGLSDGTYTYEVSAYLDEVEVPVPTAEENLHNGRPADAQPTNDPVGVVESGAFTVSDGVAVSQDVEELE